jgi:hypothetical protein
MDVARLASSHYGYGWCMGEVDGHWLRFHDGGNARFSAFMIQVPAVDAVVILLSNEQVPLHDHGLRLVAELVGGAC